jgi:phosphoesterase RecJ-like protein
MVIKAMNNLDEILDKLINFNKIGITFHTSPDGDSLGSALGLFQILKKLNKDVYVLSKEKIPDSFKFLPYSCEIKKHICNVKEGTDCVIVLDCGNTERINASLDLNDRKYFLMNIDHHLSNEVYGDLNYIDIKASAVGEIVYSILDKIGVELDQDIAKCLYTSILTDTGSFKHSSTTKTTHDIAGKLINTGMNFTEIHRVIFDNKRLEKIKLYGRVIDTIHLECNSRVCFMEITKDMIEELGLEDEDSSDVIDFGTKVDTAEVTILIKEKEEGVKVSLRSKSVVDVRKIAEYFGGGGHIRAAGFASEKNKDEITSLLKEILNKELI